MNPLLLQIIQNYINLIEGIFDREPSELSIQEYDEYLQAIKDCYAQNIFLSVSRQDAIENYLYFEINGV